MSHRYRLVERTAIGRDSRWDVWRLCPLRERNGNVTQQSTYRSKVEIEIWRVYLPSQLQGCGSVLIFSGFGSGSGSRVWCWRPFRIRIRIQYGSRVLMTKNWKKITAEIFFFFFWSKTAIYLSLGLHKVCPSYRRSLQFSKEAIQHFKTWTFTNYCLLLWVIFFWIHNRVSSQLCTWLCI